MEQQKSEFNYAIEWLNRINQCFMSAGMSAQRLDAYSWYQSLLLIYRELSTEMKEKDPNVERATRLKAEIYDDLKIWVRVANKKGFYINPVLFKKLDEMEISLRKIMDSAGLQTRRAEGEAAWRF